MGVQLLLLKEKTKENLFRFWYWLVKPIDLLLTYGERKRRERENALIVPEDVHAKRMARCIILYLIKEHSRTNQAEGMEYIISGQRFDEETFFWCYHLGNRDGSILKGEALKYFYKFNYTVDFQMKVINELRKQKRIRVEEIDLESEVKPYQFKTIEEYYKTFRISLVDGK